jgi:hypothetical protein
MLVIMFYADYVCFFGNLRFFKSKKSLIHPVNKRSELFLQANFTQITIRGILQCHSRMVWPAGCGQNWPQLHGFHSSTQLGTDNPRWDGLEVAFLQKGISIVIIRLTHNLLKENIFLSLLKLFFPTDANETFAPKLISRASTWLHDLFDI